MKEFQEMFYVLFVLLSISFKSAKGYYAFQI